MVPNYMFDCHGVHNTILVVMLKHDITVCLGSRLRLTLLTLTLNHPLLESSVQSSRVQCISIYVFMLHNLGLPFGGLLTYLLFQGL